MTDLVHGAADRPRPSAGPRPTSAPRPDLRPHAPDAARARVRAWADEMRQVHARLRAALDLAREQIEDEHTPDLPAVDPLLYCWGFCAALSGHHRSEDTVLFPRVTAQHPDLAPVVAQLVQDHHMIEHLLGGLTGAIEADASTDEKLRHLDGVQAVMTTHFRYEERRLLDVLDGVLGDAVAPGDAFGPLA
jgi:hemerythrin-like domain-containing protein